MNILLAQLPIADAYVEINLSNMLSIIRNAPLDTDLIVFPETTLSGFPTRDEIDSTGLTTRSKPIRLIQEAARKAIPPSLSVFAKWLTGGRITPRC